MSLCLINLMISKKIFAGLCKQVQRAEACNKLVLVLCKDGSKHLHSKLVDFVHMVSMGV